MRWMKHLTLAHDDDALAALIEEMGPEGYGIYWLLLEHIGAGIEKDSDVIPSRVHSILKWSQLCHCSTRIFRKFADRTAELKLIECKSQAELKQFSSRLPIERLQIDVPNLLKYRDEYSKKSGQTPADVRSRLDRDRDKREKEEVEQNSSPKSPGKTVEKPAGEWAHADTFRLAWSRHMKHRRDQPLDVVAAVLIGRASVDWNRVAEVHPAYCDSWARKNWDYCGLTFLEWIDAGMPEPTPEAGDAKQADRQAVIEAEWRALEQ